MRFKAGSKVEVMSKKEVPISWRPAEIISGNGHTYSVRYDYYPSTKSEVVVERVPRKAIRPCPPSVECLKHWVAGDVVEVFDDNSWKIAALLKVLGVDLYLARLLGSAREFRVHRLNIRVRQSWQDGTWVLMEKGSASCRDMKLGKLSTSNCYQKKSFQVPQANARIKCQSEDERNGGLQESLIASGTLKRASLFCLSVDEAYAGNVQKARAIEKEGRRQRVVQAPLLEKGHSWRHASIASKGLKMMLRVVTSLAIELAQYLCPLVYKEGNYVKLLEKSPTTYALLVVG